MEVKAEEERLTEEEEEPDKDPTHAQKTGYVAPDGGYGWVVVVMCFMIHVIVDGAAFGYGVISNHIKEYYGATESQATLVGSLQLGFYLLSCPVAGKLVERFGFRIVCFSGSIIAAIGFCTSQFAPNIGILMLTYGVIAGTGFGMMYLSCISAVTLYFDKKRVLATGLATMGSGIGMFAFSAICNYLIDLFDWKNAVFIMGGIILQGCVFAMLLRPLPKPSADAKDVRVDEEGSSLLAMDNAGESGRRCGEESGFQSADSSQKGSKEAMSADDVLINSRRILEQGVSPKTPAYIVKLKQDIANEYINSMNSLHNMAISPRNIHEQDDDVLKTQSKHMTSRSRTFRNCLSHIVDLSLLHEPIFYIICIANIFTFLGAFIPLKFQVDRAMTFDLADSEERTQEMASFLVSVSGIASTLGRGSSALLGVRKGTNKLLFHNIAVLGCGVACFFNVFSVNYPLMVIFATVFTFFFGIYIALSSVVVCDMLGPEAVNNAFALMCMLRGFANIAGGPIAGAAYDVLQDYDVCFYIGGAMVTLGALSFFLLMLPTIQKRSFHHQIQEMDIDIDLNNMITSMTNVNAPTDQDKILICSAASMGGSVLGGSVLGSKALVESTSVI